MGFQHGNQAHASQEPSSLLGEHFGILVAADVTVNWLQRWALATCGLISLGDSLAHSFLGITLAMRRMAMRYLSMKSSTYVNTCSFYGSGLQPSRSWSIYSAAFLGEWILLRFHGPCHGTRGLCYGIPQNNNALINIRDAAATLAAKGGLPRSRVLEQVSI